MIHQLPKDLRKIDADDRLRWSIVAAEQLVKASIAQAGPAGLEAIVSRGREEFKRRAAPVYADHQFRTSDLDRIFDIAEEALNQFKAGLPFTVTA